MLARVFRTSSLLAPRSLCSNFNRSYTENDDSFIRQYFFRKSFLKPFTIANENNLLSVSCMKGRFKQHKDYIALDKLGTILMEFIPYTKDSENYRNLDYKSKKNFALSLNHVGQILKYNPYSFVESKIDLEFKYNITSQAQGEEKILTLKKTAKEEKLQVALNSQKQGGNSNVSIKMDMGEFIILQELLRYSIPYMLGWHIMSSPRIAEEEFSSNPPEKGENLY